ncbi:Protein 4.1 [Acropora cervicornis]|uniref:Protein 4.1 n=1 Tax=Acropora cervicornis TaxID=6130 RepID=A0AAD9V3L6_ACRCE|nr:Protein 4.1 [Acropora cervicornis]
MRNEAGPILDLRILRQYLMVLQLREDLLKGRLQCSVPIHALLGSFVVQAECGDFEPDEHGENLEYLSEFKFSPRQVFTVGQLKHQYVVQQVERIETFRTKLFGSLQGNDTRGRRTAILGQRQKTSIVRSRSAPSSGCRRPVCNRRSFGLGNSHLSQQSLDKQVCLNDSYGAVSLSFRLGSLRATKRLWKVGVEHHSFFRLSQTDLPHKEVGFMKLGSKFRYSGRTQHQARHSQEINRAPPDFERVSSKRFSSKVLDGNRRSETIQEIPKVEEGEEVEEQQPTD